ncbi:MAG TPA: thiolase family protein [Bacteroidia bacterium]|mgnify:CR=1 FL=1|nr:thiolase family protein [Bacteroidia bacterium]
MKGYFNSEKGIGIIFDDIYLVNGIRTPFGKLCGTLGNLSPTELGIIAANECLKKLKFSSKDIHQVVAANIGQASADAYFLPRHIALYTNIPVNVPALMVQKICGSGLETIITAAEQITLQKAENVLCVGTESMSQMPTSAFGNRMGYPLGKPGFVDMLWESLDDTAAGYSMGETAENVAEKFNITRKECDEFALLSFERAIKAKQNGFFENEIVKIPSELIYEREGIQPKRIRIKTKDYFNTDEHIKETSLEKLSKLPTVFRSNGVQTAGNSSGMVDGAASVLVSHKNQINSKNQKPLVKIVAAASSGINPKYMGLGPVPAIKYLLEITGLKISDIGLFEINEAFAAQVLGCVKILDLNINQLNINGGAIAIGHPLGATGIRISLTLARAMRQNKVKYGIASACIGGGQGTAILYELA